MGGGIDKIGPGKPPPIKEGEHIATDSIANSQQGRDETTSEFMEGAKPTAPGRDVGKLHRALVEQDLSLPTLESSSATIQLLVDDFVNQLGDSYTKGDFLRLINILAEHFGERALHEELQHVSSGILGKLDHNPFEIGLLMLGRAIASYEKSFEELIPISDIPDDVPSVKLCKFAAYNSEQALYIFRGGEAGAGYGKVDLDILMMLKPLRHYAYDLRDKINSRLEELQGGGTDPNGSPSSPSGMPRRAPHSSASNGSAVRAPEPASSTLSMKCVSHVRSGAIFMGFLRPASHLKAGL